MAKQNTLKQEALSWPEKAKAITITDNASYTAAGELVKEVVAMRKRVQDHHKPIKDAAHKAHKAAIAAEKELLKPLEQAEQWLKSEMTKWQREQARLAEMERRRLEAEQKEREEEQRLALAAEAEQQGASQEVVDEILETPLPQAPIATPVTTEMVEGISTRTLYSAEVTNLKVLCLAIGMGKVSESLVQPNMVALNGMARSMRDGFNVAGCKLVKTDSMSVRS